MPPPEQQIPSCDLLVVVATTSERESLEKVAKSKGCDFQRVRQSPLGPYYDLGKIGDDRTIAVRTSGMGPLSYRGSADLALRFKQLTGATAIVQLGMAFGVNPDLQSFGDVLISSCLIPYDSRDYIENPCWSRRWSGKRKGGYLRRLIGLVRPTTYRIDYSRAETVSAGPIFHRFKNECDLNASSRKYKVFSGPMLSGSARVFSETFRDELIASVPQGVEPIVGGEMEAIGLLGVAETPIWCVVKGISDFGDSNRDEVIAKKRTLACENATDFFYSTLLNPPADDIIKVEFI